MCVTRKRRRDGIRGALSEKSKASAHSLSHDQYFYFVFPPSRWQSSVYQTVTKKALLSLPTFLLIVRSKYKSSLELTFLLVCYFHRGIPNYEFKLGKITFIRNSRPMVKKVEEVSLFHWS